MKITSNKFGKKLFIAYIFYFLSGLLGSHWLFLKKPGRALIYILSLSLIFVLPFFIYNYIPPVISPLLLSNIFSIFLLYMWIKDYKKIPAEIDRVKQKTDDLYRVHFNTLDYIFTFVYFLLITILLFPIFFILALVSSQAGSSVDLKTSTNLLVWIVYLFIDFEQNDDFLLPFILFNIFITTLLIGLFGILIAMVLNIVKRKYKHISKYLSYINNISTFLLALSVSTWPTPVIMTYFMIYFFNLYLT